MGGPLDKPDFFFLYSSAMAQEHPAADVEGWKLFVGACDMTAAEGSYRLIGYWKG